MLRHPSPAVSSPGLVDRVASSLLSTHCPGCGQPRCTPCDYCRWLVDHLPQVDAPPGTWALRPYHGVMCDVIVGMKYANRPGVAAWLAELADEVRPQFADVDVITWAPTSRRRRRERGFDQAELLARAVARRWRVPVRGLLQRDDSPSQTGRRRGERLAGPAFRARRAHRWHHILVIDDVVTTGATLRAAAEALREAGCARVSPMAVAATPRPATLAVPGRPVPAVPGR